MQNDNDRISNEYLKLQDIVEDFDRRALTIKSWSITLSMAGIGAGILKDNATIILLSSLTAMLFWIIEALWKTHQQHLYSRIYEIERAIRDKKTIPPFQIASTWSSSFQTKNKHFHIWKVIWWPHIFLPHFAIIIGGIILWLSAQSI